jgi:hypothetical protein
MPLIQSKQLSAEHSARVAAGDTVQTFRVRISMLALGSMLGLYALWQLAAVVAHPAAPYFLAVGRTDHAGLAPAAARAAEIAQIRGDLWFDDALLTWQDAISGSGTDQASVVDDARGAVVRAARLAPHDARAWLLLALIGADRGADPAQQAEALKMSYYTGPNDAALIPSRLKLAVQSPAIADPDFQQLVSGEVLAAIREPALRGAIIAAYRGASTDGKRFLRSAVGALDAGLIAQMQAADSDPLRF